jgi:hypothetical protein
MYVCYGVFMIRTARYTYNCWHCTLLALPSTTLNFSGFSDETRVHTHTHTNTTPEKRLFHILFTS